MDLMRVETNYRQDCKNSINFHYHIVCIRVCPQSSNLITSLRVVRGLPNQITTRVCGRMV